MRSTLTVAGAAEGAQRFSGGLSRVRAARTPRAVKPKAAIIGEDTASVGTGVRQVEVTRTADAALCFVAGTPVATADGPRPIEEIEVGDLVLAKNEETGKVGLHEVVQLFVTPDREVLDLTIETADGTAETLGVTPTHPFWVEGRGWVKAGDLQSGDRLTDAEGEVLRVVASEARSARETVYNFEVAEVHTYFAGELRAWVHNECRAGAKGQGVTFDSRVDRFRDKATGQFTNPVSTGPDEAFFWSGRTSGVGGESVARRIARDRGGVTLEALIEERGIELPPWDPANSSSLRAWQEASRRYAASTSGEVRAVVGESLRPGSVWEEVELPALRKNPDVTRVTVIDPATGAERVIFER